MWVILVALVTVGAVEALDTTNLTGDAILNRILDDVLEDVPEPRFGISRTQWVMTGSISETWSQYSSTSGSTFGAGVAEYYGAGAAASISGPDGIMRTRYNSLYPGFGFTGEWIMLPRQHKRFHYEIQYKHSKINVNVLMSQLWASVILRDNIVTVFGYILNRPSNFLSEELYTSLYHIYDAIRLRRVQIYGLIHVLQDVSFASPTEQFLYIFQGLRMVVPRYLLGAVQIWIDTLRLEPVPLDEVMRPNGGPLVVDFLAGIEASVIRILREPIEWNPFTAPNENAVLSNLMGPVFVEIFAALEAGTLALTQALFGLILINRPLNEVIPEKDETERYLVDILRLGNVESWENIIKPVTNKDRGDPEILIPKVLTQISISKETDALVREEARYIIPYLKPPSNTYANKYYNTVSPVISKPSIDLLLLLKSITKVEYPLEVVEDKDRIVHFILDGHLDIEFIVKGFNRFDHDTPINVLIALLTRIERRLPKLPPEIISSVRSLQLYLIYRRFLCSMSSTIPMEFLDISSLINAFANVRVPTHVYVLVQKLVVTLPYEDVPWRELIKEVSIEECTRPRKCIHHIFKLVLERNYITKGPSFKILVELMGYLNEDGDPWEMVPEEKSCVPLPKTTQSSKMTTTYTKPWTSTWSTTRDTGRSSTPTTVRTSTVRSEPTEEEESEVTVSKGTPRAETAKHSSNTEPCDEDIFTMEATTETQPRRKHTTVMSTERSVSSTRHLSSTVRTQPTEEDECEEGVSKGTPRTENVEQTSETEPCDEDVHTVEVSTQTQSRWKHTTARSTETSVSSTGGDNCGQDYDDTFTSTTRRPDKLRSTEGNEEVGRSEETEQARYHTTPSAALKSTPSSQTWEDNTDCAETVTEGDRFSEAPRATGNVGNDCSDEETSTKSGQPTRTTENVSKEEGDVECSKEELHQATTSSQGREVTKKVTKEVECSSEEVNEPGCDDESTEEFTTKRSRQTTRRPRESEEQTENTDECDDKSSESKECRENRDSDESDSSDSDSDEESKESPGPCDSESAETSEEGDKTEECSEEETTQKSRTSPRGKKGTTKHVYPKSSTKATNEDECSDEEGDIQHSTEKYPKTRQTESTKKVTESSRKVTGATTKRPRFSVTPSYTDVDGHKTTKKGSTSSWKVTRTTPKMKEKCYGERGEEIDCDARHTKDPRTTKFNVQKTTKTFSTTSLKVTHTTPRVNGKCYGPRGEEIECSRLYSSTTESSSSRTRPHTYSTSIYVPGATRSTGTASTVEEPWLTTTPEDELHPTRTEKSSWPHWSTPSRKTTTSKPVQSTSAWPHVPRSTTRHSTSTSFGDGKHSTTTESSSRTRPHTYSTSIYIPGGTRTTGIASTQEESWITTTPEDDLHPTRTEKSSWPHWSTPSTKTTTWKPGQFTSSWTEIPKSTTTRSPFTISWPSVTRTRNFTTTRLPISWTFPTRAQSTHTAASNSWPSWQTWTPAISKQTTNRADASTSQPRLEFTRTPATPPWQFQLNGSWSEWNGTFVGFTKHPSGGLTAPSFHFNFTNAAVTGPSFHFNFTHAGVPTPPTIILNGSSAQWNGTWSNWNYTNASFTSTSTPHDGTPSWGVAMPNFTWPLLNSTSVVGFGAEMNWSLSYLLRESKIFTSQFVIEYVKKIHSQGRYSIQYVPTPQEVENAKFPPFDEVHGMEPPSVEHPETCLVPTQYGTLEDFKLKPLRFLLSSPELYQYLGPDFNPGKYSTKGELLLAILERFIQIQTVQANTNVYSYISNYINFIRDSKKSQGPSVTINFVSLLNALPFAVSEQEVRYLTRITDFMSVSEFYKLLGPTFNPSKHKTRGPMLKYTFEFMMTLSIVQEDKLLLEALRYFVGKIYMQGYGGQAVEWVLMREVDQVQAVDVRSVFRAIDHDKLSKAALQAESNVLNFIFNEFIPSVHFQDFKLSQFKTKGQLLQGAFRYLLTQNTVNPKVKADIITLMPYIRFDGPGVEPVDFDPFSR